MRTNFQFPNPNGLNNRRIESFYNEFAAFCTEHFGAQPCDLALDWHSVGATLRFRNLVAHIDLNLWIVSHGAEGLPDNLVRVETWAYYPMRSEIHSAEALQDFIKQQLDKGIDEENLLALQDLLLTQVTTAKSMQKEFQDKIVNFATLTSLAHNFTHLAFDTVRRTSRPTNEAPLNGLHGTVPADNPTADLAVIVPVPSYPGTLIRIRE